MGLELDRVGLVSRLLGLLSRVPWSRLFLGESVNDLPPAEAATGLMNLHAATLEALPLHLEVGPPYGWDYTRLRPMVDALCRCYPGRPPLVVVDYLQLVKGEATSRIYLALAKRRARPMGCQQWPWVAYRFNGGWFEEEPGWPEASRREEEGRWKGTSGGTKARQKGTNPPP